MAKSNLSNGMQGPDPRWNSLPYRFVANSIRVCARKFGSAFLGLALTWGAGSAVMAQPSARQTLNGHVPAVTAGLQPIRHLEGTNVLRLAIGLPFRDPASAAVFLEQLYDPSSPNYHRFLTREQFNQRFGAAEADYQAVAAFAEANRLALRAAYSNRMVLDVEGSVADIERALGLKIQVYQHPTEAREFFAPDQEPSLQLSTPILHISGLDNLVRARPLFVRNTAAVKHSATPALGSAPDGGYLGHDFRSAYVPGVNLTGTGQTVGLLEFDSGFYQSDITAYESLAGLPNVPVTPVLIDGYSGAPGNGNDEVSLDIEMAISMAPGLSGVTVYEGSTTDDILSQMASDSSVKQFGASWTYGVDAESDVLFQEMAMQGQSFFNASGDSDAYVGGVPSPSDDTNITVVGGTTLSTAGPGGAWTSEKVWNWGGGTGGSGGISTTYGIPPWQEGISMAANKGSTTARNLPDVALTGDNVFVISGGGVQENLGGTSCATPLWAGFLALVNQQGVALGLGTQGFINPAVYAIGKGPIYRQCFHDTEAGNNTWSGSPNLFYAVPGYDLCTGWGTPAGQTLINALAPDTLMISPTPALVAAGPMGGPFTPTSARLVLTNTSASSLSWSCGSLVTWIGVSTNQGILSPGDTQTVTVSVVSAAASLLAPGVYSASDIVFTNNTDGFVQTVPNTLEVTPPPHLGDYATPLLSYGPIAYWPLNETNSVPGADVAVNSGLLGFGGDGFAYGGVQQGLPGIVSNCAAFSNPGLVVAYLGSHLDVGFNPALNRSGAFTVEFWAKPNQAPNDFFCPVSSLDDSENSGNARYGWIFYMASGNQWVFRVGNGSGYVAAPTGGTVQVGTWQHVAGVYNGSTATLYVNGVAVAGPTTASGFSPNTNVAVPLRIGATSFGNRTFDGSVDEVAVYTNALSAATLLAHYNAASTNNAGYGAQILASQPAGYWRLDEPSYSEPLPGTLPTAYNFGTLGYLANGVYQAGCAPGAAGVPGAGFGNSNLACSFAGTSYIDVPGGSFNLTGPLTVSAWVRSPAAAGQTESIVSLGAGSVQLTVSGQGAAQFVDGAQSLGALQSTNSIVDGLWHNLVGTYDGASTESLYVDGRLAAKSTAATVQPVSNGNDLFIGNDADAGIFQYFDGVIDEVALFTNTLSSNQIAWLYAVGFEATRLAASVTHPFSGVVTLTGPAVPGQRYELQYSTNLSRTNWTIVSGPVTATNSTLVFTNAPGSAGDVFYRAVLVP